jgi:hypothetical protein
MVLYSLVALSRAKGQLVSLKYEVEWFSEMVWTFWRREKYLLPMPIFKPQIVHLLS